MPRAKEENEWPTLVKDAFEGAKAQTPTAPTNFLQKTPTIG